MGSEKTVMATGILASSPGYDHPMALEEAEERANTDLLATAPALVRIAVTAYVRTLGWGLGVTVKMVDGTLRLVLTGQGADALASEVREQIKRLVGVTDLEARLGRLPEPPPEPGENSNGHRADQLAVLKERGAELLARSADVEDDEPAHPAYERILTSLAPDEARILRLMCVEGSRAAVDIRTWRPLDVGSELVEQGLSMIGQEAGCRHINRVPAYLDNLHRLGLIWFSREQLDDLSAYQVLEAQPEVQQALEKAGRARTIRRSVHLTSFGHDFCETCLPLDTAGFLALQDEVGNKRA
jgi:Abortive infection alpha